MTRIRLDHPSETSAFAWHMQCDRCGHRDATPYPGRNNQPPLFRFLLLGWAPGDTSDRCPKCVVTEPFSAGWVPYFTAARLEEMRAATEPGANPRRLLEGLTGDELAALRVTEPAATVVLCRFTRDGRKHAASLRSTPCCTSHLKPLCCFCYRRTHFVETGCNCCPDGRAIRAEMAAAGTTP